MKKTLLFTAMLLASNAFATQYQDTFTTVVQESEKISNEVFPNGDVKLYSPAFVNGWSVDDEFTSYEDMMKFVKDIADKNDWATLHSLGNSQEGRDIPYLMLSNGKDSDSKLRVWLQGGLHGNEPGGGEGMLALLGEMNHDQEKAQKWLNGMDILVIPRLNVDGTAYFQRRTAKNIDINRDYTKLEVPETVLAMKKFNEFVPQVVVDAHEYTPHKKGLKNKNFSFSFDAFYSPAKNLNLDKPIRDFANQVLIGNLKKDLDAKGYTHDDYIWMPGSGKEVLNEPGPDARVGRNGMALTNAVVMLTETRGIGIGMQHYPRRVDNQLTMNESILNSSLENKDKIIKITNDAIAKTIADGKKGTTDIIISTKKTKGKRDFIFVDNANDKLVKVNWNANLSGAGELSADLTRKRPTAYIVPPPFNYVSKKLELLGLTAKYLDNPQALKVETYTVTENKPKSKLYEGIFRNSVKTKAGERTITFPVGTAIFTMAQKNANLMVMALEPESTDSYVTFNIIPVQKGDEIPVFRYHGTVE